MSFPHRPLKPLALALAIMMMLPAGACGTTGAEPFTYPIAVAGAGASFPIGDWQVTLDRADLALGPLYLCATAAASPELCEVALGEFAEVAVIDLLAAEPQPIGEVLALAGDVRSAMLDYGISWFTTQARATAGSELGHSAHLSGTAVRGADILDFDAVIDVLPPLRGSPALVGVRARVDDPDQGSRLLLRINPGAWLLGLDFDALAALGPDVEIRPGDPAHATIAFAMTTQPPVFSWTHE
ncbi:MAG: hypothetical protein H0T76_11970 [Nannocystis sp.]|nr:hypothetical protein [Nannocystis sp.]MBA3547194.1 hypothetical protein [Nannocystis sp.]